MLKIPDIIKAGKMPIAIHKIKKIIAKTNSAPIIFKFKHQNFKILSKVTIHYYVLNDWRQYVCALPSIKQVKSVLHKTIR